MVLAAGRCFFLSAWAVARASFTHPCAILLSRPPPPPPPPAPVALCTLLPTDVGFQQPLQPLPAHSPAVAPAPRCFWRADLSPSPLLPRRPPFCLLHCIPSCCPVPSRRRPHRKRSQAHHPPRPRRHASGCRLAPRRHGPLRTQRRHPAGAGAAAARTAAAAGRRPTRVGAGPRGCGCPRRPRIGSCPCCPYTSRGRVHRRQRRRGRALGGAARRHPAGCAGGGGVPCGHPTARPRCGRERRRLRQRRGGAAGEPGAAVFTAGGRCARAQEVRHRVQHGRRAAAACKVGARAQSGGGGLGAGMA